MWALRGGRGLKAICVGLDEALSPSEPHLPCVENGVSPSSFLLADTVRTLGFQVLSLNPHDNPGVIGVPISQMRKLRESGSSVAAQGYASGKRQTLDVNPGPRAPTLGTVCCQPQLVTVEYVFSAK